MRDVSVLLLITRDDHRQFPDRSEHGSERTVRIEPEQDFATVRRADETRVVLTAACSQREPDRSRQRRKFCLVRSGCRLRAPGKVLPKGLRKLSAKLMANRSDRRLAGSVAKLVEN